MSLLKPPVGPSEDLTRILALPRRPQLDLTSTRGLAMAELMTRKLSRSNPYCECQGVCIKALKPVQAWALYEASKGEGLAGAIGVGSGKTGLGILMPLVMSSKVAVILLPPGQVAQLVRDHAQWSQHFNTPSLIYDNQTKGQLKPGSPTLYVLPYSQLSTAKSTALLETLKPDLILADEAHKLRYKDTATTARVLRYLVSHPETRFCFWSGTLTSKSIKDYAHLLAFALREGSPLPLSTPTVEEWSLALDPSDWQAPGGALAQLCHDGEPLSKGYHRRFVETLGVVATQTSSIDASIVFEERQAPPIPTKVQEAIKDLRASWVRPDGEELVDILQVTSTARELAAGFFYRWRFPRGEPDSVILKWFSARKAWHKELRDKLKCREEHLDSPLLCAQAAIRSSQGYRGDLPVWRSDTWGGWVEVRETVEPQSEAVWIDTYLAEDSAKWALANRGIVWTEAQAFGAKVAELAGLPYHAGGPNADRLILAETGKRSLVASIKAHGTGRDGLQKLFSRQLVSNPPSSGATWEQLLGRLHRIGQGADEVTTEVYRHTPEYAEAIDSAILKARYTQDTLGTQQKLINTSASWGLEIKS